MILSELKIHHLRNIASAQIDFNSRFNFISGPNGSGKTSILEALYLLSCGHSFRSREISPIISHEEATMTVFARSLNQETISIQKSRTQPTQIKINNYFCSTTSQLAYALPCQIFYSDIFQIIDAGPSVRRSMLDWGLFHVKHEYLFILKEYKRVLKQRNALLKKHAPYSHFIPWDKQLSDFADQLHQLRENYFQRWQNEFIKVLNELTDLDCKLIYLKGWDRKNTGKNLEQILIENFSSDQQKLYTQYGAHQADILIETDRYKAKHVLSRGQQKIILFAMKLAQSHFLDHECLYLIDDLSSELDEDNQQKIIFFLSKRKGQYVITTTSAFNSVNSLISNDNYSKFQINSGVLNTF